MTAKEIVNQAKELSIESSMLEVATLKNSLNRISDLITSEQGVIKFWEAKNHIEMIEKIQAERAASGDIIRIM